uniref:Reverse transcriptase domain-containing protein n=1 Tax=Tanacetum cinerariifolium TaxID=118510 RepID=A0A6L2LF09_TANCI|nr:hypothetical protein [Tanacetum cinerariifolium]
MDAVVRNQRASIKTLEIQIGQVSKVLQERGFGSLPSSTEANPRDQVKSISTTIEVDSCPIRRASVSVMPLLTCLNLGLDMPEDIKVPLILRRPFLSTTHAKIDVYKRKFTLRVREEKIVFTSVKPASSLIKKVYMLSLKERIELDLEARLMELQYGVFHLMDTAYQSPTVQHEFEDYIKLNDLNEPIKLRRNQGEDLMPTIKEGEVIKEFRTRDEDLDTGIDDYPSYCDYDKKIHIDCAHNLKEVGINSRRFEGTITLYKDDKSVTYQMVQSHQRFKRHINEKCNKIPPLLKVSDEDKMNKISHPYQKLKGFYKGVLNLGPDYIRDSKMEEWLTRGHISVHEME